MSLITALALALAVACLLNIVLTKGGGLHEVAWVLGVVAALAIIAFDKGMLRL